MRNYVNHMASGVEEYFCRRGQWWWPEKASKSYHIIIIDIMPSIPDDPMSSQACSSLSRAALSAILNPSGRREKFLFCKELLRSPNAKLLEYIPTPSLCSGNWGEHQRMFCFLPISQKLFYLYQLWIKNILELLNSRDFSPVCFNNS